MNVGCDAAQLDLSVQNLSFDRIPGQSRLFLDYLSDPLALKKFYPSVVASHRDLPERAPEVLANYATSRDTLADALAALNSGWGASSATLENIEKLRQADCVAVVTGQQAGLFTGALYTIYKAISTVKVAEDLNRRGLKAVPVFWIASEDHDFAEVAATEILDREGNLTRIAIEGNPLDEGLPVGKIALGESVNEAIEKLFAALPETNFTGDLETLVRAAYQPQYTLSESFARLMTGFFGKFGLILLDPLDENLKRLAAPIYASAIECAAEMTSAMIARSGELEAAGYHAQVLVKDDSFPLFWTDDRGRRCALHRTKDGRVTTKCTRHNFEIADLKQIALENPARLSPNVTLRATVQDYLLPTIAYFGGAAEIAYFAQSSEAYRILQRPATPIFHRASVTVVEPQQHRTLTEYNLNPNDFLTRQECWLPQVVEEFLNPETSAIFSEAEKTIAAQLDVLGASLTAFDVTLGQSLDRRRPKILHHLNASRQKFYQSEIGKNEAVKRRLETTCAALFPHKSLQERSFNAASLFARHGECLLQRLWHSINIDTTEHQMFFL